MKEKKRKHPVTGEIHPNDEILFQVFYYDN